MKNIAKEILKIAKDVLIDGHSAGRLLDVHFEKVNRKLDTLKDLGIELRYLWDVLQTLDRKHKYNRANDGAKYVESMRENVDSFQRTIQKDKQDLQDVIDELKATILQDFGR